MRSRFKTLNPVATLVVTILTSLSSFAAPFVLDTSHTDVGFSVKHLMVSNTRGTFKDVKGTFDFDEAKNVIKNVSVEIKVDSIDTKDAKRDEHLKSPDFFDTAKFPLITFKADSLTVKENKPTKITGTLTMRGVSKPVTLDLTYTGKNTDPYGVLHAGFNLTGKINRKDFGVSWNKALDKGGVAVGEEVTIDISGEIVPSKDKR
ncbi:MAG: YceI family protein [Pseudobdellovibrionaceae bacterium]